MAISIIANLEATPSPTSLPRRIEFRQTLRSSRPEGEDIEVLYILDPAIPFHFVDTNEQRVKQIQREETVADDDQICVDRMTIVQEEGSPPVALLQINQTIRDADGNVIGDSCPLRLV